MDNEKVLIVGLDGATWTVLEPWIEDGTLPNLRRLRQEGAWGDLRSSIPPLTAPAWSSFLTGKNPGKHGVFHFIPLDDRPPAEAGAPPTVDGRSIKSSTLWDILGHHGRHVGVMNVPMSYPPRPVNGFIVTGLLTPPGARFFTYPPELSERLAGYQIDLDRFIDHKPFARTATGEHRKREVEVSLQLVHEFYEMEEKRALTALELMDSEPWDVFMVVFAATDRMGHYLWPYHRASDLDDSDFSRDLHDAIRNVYRRIDEHIGTMVDRAGEDASIIVMSDHGMGPIYHKNTHWNNWLYKQGYVTIESDSQRSPDAWLLRLGIPRDKIRRLVQRIPGLYGSRMVQKAKKVTTAAIDYQRSQAYYVRIFDPVGGIRVNETGPAKDELCDRLIHDLYALTDPETGQPIVRWARRREECFTGPYAEELPDIIVVMHPQYGSSDRLSNYSAVVTDRPQIGDPGGHHIEGIFIAHGPQVRAQPQPITEAQIEDMAPTILHLLGLPVPGDMDGRVLTDILVADGATPRPVKTSPPLGKWPSEAEATPLIEELTAANADGVRARLRALGYVD